MTALEKAAHVALAYLKKADGNSVATEQLERALGLISCDECKGDGWLECAECGALGFVVAFRKQVSCDAQPCCGRGRWECLVCDGKGSHPRVSEAANDNG